MSKNASEHNNTEYQESTKVPLTSFNISKRLRNICLTYEMIYVEDLLKYKQIHGDFFKLENCGKKTVTEILEILYKYHQEHKAEDPILKKGDLEYYSAYIKLRKGNLSVRSQNVIDHIISNYDLKKDYYKLINEKFLLKIKNSGRKTAKELSSFFNKMYSSSSISNDEKSKELLYYCLLHNIPFSDKINLEESRTKNDIDSLLNLDLVSVISITAINYLDERDLMIWFLCNDQENEMTSLAKEYNLSRERVRQISKSITKQAKNLANTLHSIFKKTEVKPKLIDKSNLIFYNQIIPQDLVSINLILEIISYLEEYSYYKKSKEIDQSFIIANNINSLLDLKSLSKHIYTITKSKLNNGIEIKYKELVDKYKNANITDYEAITAILKEILKNIKGLTVGDSIIIKRATKKKDFEYIKDILEFHQEPMHINEILKELIESGYKKESYKPENVRSHCLNHPDVFINTAWSTYGLKIWEKEKQMLGGTIKQIVKKYLQKFDSPKHIYEIFSFVKSYRDTNKHSVWGNINLDPQNIFKVYEAGFVGLTDKEYSFSATKFKKVTNHWFRFYSKNYILKGVSKYPLEKIINDLSSDLKVKPIQIEDQIMDRISEGELFLDNNSYLHSSIHSIQESTFEFDQAEKRLLKRNNKLMSRLDLISMCIELAKKRGHDLTITESKRIIDNL